MTGCLQEETSLQTIKKVSEPNVSFRLMANRFKTACFIKKSRFTNELWVLIQPIRNVLTGENNVACLLRHFATRREDLLKWSILSLGSLCHLGFFRISSSILAVTIIRIHVMNTCNVIFKLASLVSFGNLCLS